MKSWLFVLLSISNFIESCHENNSNYQEQLLTKDVPKFINLLPTISHDNMAVAFEQVNAVLNYEKASPPTSEGTIEASSKTPTGKTSADGHLTLLASSLLPHSDSNEFGLLLISYPNPIKDTILKLAIAHLHQYEMSDIDGVPTWEINNWLLQVKGDNTIRYFAKSKKSIYDLFK